MSAVTEPIGGSAGSSGGGLFGGVRAVLGEVVRNPVLRREMDERAASTRAAVAMTVWLLLLSGLALLVYLAYSSETGFDPVTDDSARIGKDLFEWTLFGMLGLVLFLVPAFTASAVAGERTRQTLVPVQMTTLSPLSIVLGKTLAAVAFTVLLVVAAAPILALAFLIGGVGLTDVAKGLGMVILTAVVLGAVGIMFSALFRKVQGAIVMTYGFVLAISIGTFILLGVVAIFQSISDDDFGPSPNPPKELLAPNPFVALADATGGSDANVGNNALSGIRSLVEELERERQWFDVVGPNVQELENRETTALWRWYVVAAILAVYTSLYVATGRLRTPAPTER